MENQVTSRPSDEPRSIAESLPKISAYDSVDWNAYESNRLKREADEDRQRKEKDNRDAQATRIRLWENSGVPARHADFILPGSGAWLETFRRLDGLVGSGVLFVVMGVRGTGKTQIGTSLVKEACQRCRSARYVKALDIFIALRGSFRREGLTEDAVIESYLQPRLLVIDALEERGETAFEDRLLNHIIDKRYDSLDDTILITNQTAEKFAESVGPSIVSRIHETGDKIVCDWASFRTKPAGRP